MASNSIGQYEFLVLDGFPYPPTEQIAKPTIRPGVDGMALWRTGKRGKPFTMRSKVDQTTMQVARSLFQDYGFFLPGANAVSLVQNDIHYDTEGWKVIVLDVKLVALYATAISIGGINAPVDPDPDASTAAAWMEADWTLIAV